MRGLKRLGADVHVVVTENALYFVKPKELRTPVYHEFFSKLIDYREIARKKTGTEHVSLADWTDAVVVAPCTAATIGKMAHGIADNLLAAVLLAARAPVLLAPAMNDRMYLNPVVQRSVRELEKQGVLFTGSVEGALACGRTGKDG